MITIAETLSRMNAFDVRVTLDGPGLRVIAPAGAMNADRVAFMKQNKGAIIEFLRAEEHNRVRVLNLRSTPDLDESDNADAAEGRSIIEAVKAVGGWITIEHERIVLKWHHDVMPGALIDRIMAARTAVVLALRTEDDESAECDRLERVAIENEDAFDRAGPNQPDKPKSSSGNPNPIGSALNTAVAPSEYVKA